MPFESLTPAEYEEHKTPCRHPEHEPPTHAVIVRPIKWVCPGCGREVIIRPPEVSW
jgi:predicted RNA-binding Zn-ribbon protein involved in translation (DUF1610 family)